MGPHSRQKWGIDLASWLTLAVTVALFFFSLVEKGFTHEILLEAGVFLVSIKLVLATHRERLDIQTLDKKLDRLLDRRTSHPTGVPATPLRRRPKG